MQFLLLIMKVMFFIVVIQQVISIAESGSGLTNHC